jgi:hypothetical protein
MANPWILYDNLYDYGTPVGTSTAEGYSILNIKDWKSYTFWQGTSTSAQYLTVDCGSNKTAAGYAIHKHNLGSLGAQIAIQHSSNNFVAVTTAATYTASNDLQIVGSFTTATNRYWRIAITGHTATNPRLAIACIADKLTFPTPPTSPSALYQIETINSKKISKTGQLLGGTISYRPVTLEYTFQSATYTYAWVRDNYRAFWLAHGSQGKPFFFSLDDTNATDAHWLAWMDDPVFDPELVTWGMGYKEITLEMQAIWGE